MVKTSGKQKKVRSNGYPLLSLPRAVEAARKIYDNLGQGPHLRQGLARGLGYGSFSGVVSPKIGAMTHFGLLSRMNGRYSITSRAQAIFLYPDKSCFAEIFAAVSCPVLYRALIARFVGEVLPKNLEQILIADYNITQKAALAAATNFIETIEFASLIKDERLVIPEIDSPIADENLQDIPSEFVDVAKEEKGTKIKLLSGIEIVFPDDLSYRLAMGEFANDLKNLDKRASGVE